jgi:hypothetical protein
MGNMVFKQVDILGYLLGAYALNPNVLLTYKFFMNKIVIH